MTDEPFYAPNKKPDAPRQRQPGELLFTFSHDLDRWRCELRSNPYGCEAQFLLNGEFSRSRRFDSRQLAEQWAEEERKAIEKG